MESFTFQVHSVSFFLSPYLHTVKHRMSQETIWLFPRGDYDDMLFQADNDGLRG